MSGGPEGANGFEPTERLLDLPWLDHTDAITGAAWSARQLRIGSAVWQKRSREPHRILPAPAAHRCGDAREGLSRFVRMLQHPLAARLELPVQSVNVTRFLRREIFPSHRFELIGARLEIVAMLDWPRTRMRQRLGFFGPCYREGQ